MSTQSKFIPTSSQTVGPYFRIGLRHLIECAPDSVTAGAVTIHGRVLDRDGAPVSDAMLEFWSAQAETTSHTNEFPLGFRRAATDLDGAFTVTLPRPKPAESQAPHLLVFVFARGLLRHLITRVYFHDDDPANATDAVLLSIPVERRSTLIARLETNSFHWDIILQGTNETVFFAW